MKQLVPILFLLLFIQTELFAENSTFYYLKGVECYRAGDYSEAEQNFKRATEINPSYALGHYGLGRVYILRKGGAPDAIRHLKLSVSLDPGFVRGWFKLGIAELISGKLIESLHSFREAYNRDKTFIEALYNMGVVYDLLGDEYKAFTYYRHYYKKTRGEKDDSL